MRWVHHIYLNRDSSPWEWNCVRDDSPLLKRLIAIRDRICRMEGSIDAARTRLSDWEIGGKFCVSRGYDYFRDKGRKLLWPGKVWSSFITPKHSFTLWLAARKRLPTKDRLLFLQMEEACVLCGGSRESVTHLFFSCAFSNLIWARVREWLGISRAMSTVDSALKWIRRESRGSGRNAKARCMALACTVYHIWNARNRKMFEGQVLEVEVIIFKIKLHVYRTLYSLYPHSDVDF